MRSSLLITYSGIFAHAARCETCRGHSSLPNLVKIWAVCCRLVGQCLVTGVVILIWCREMAFWFPPGSFRLHPTDWLGLWSLQFQRCGPWLRRQQMCLTSAHADLDDARVPLSGSGTRRLICDPAAPPGENEMVRPNIWDYRSGSSASPASYLCRMISSRCRCPSPMLREGPW